MVNRIFDKWHILFPIMVAAGLTFAAIVKHEKEAQQVKVGIPNYIEENYTLSDGAPCIILHGGTHSNIIGITCDYSNKPPKELY